MKREILIVEDEQRFLKVIKNALDGRDCVFYEAESVEQAIERLNDNPSIQVILLDLELPVRDGSELLEHIKGQSSKYRVIVLTGHEEYLAADRAKAYDVFAYLAKGKETSDQYLIFEVERAFWDLEKAWLGKKVEAHLEIVRSVNNLGRDINHKADQELEEVLELICDHAVELLNAYTCHIRLLDPDRGDFVLWASRGRIPNMEGIFAKRVPLSKAYAGLVAHTGETENIGDLQNRQEFKDLRDEAMRNGIDEPEFWEYMDNVRSAYIAPITTRIFGKAIDAIFNINSDEENFFLTPENEKLVEDFVSQTGLAVTKHILKKKRLEIHADYRNIGEMLGEISNIFIAGEGELNKIYNVVFKRISAGLKPEIISIFLLDETAERLKNVAEYRAGEWVEPVDEEYRPGTGIVGRVYSEQMPRLFVNLQDISPGQAGDDSLPEGFAEENIKDIPSGQLRHYLAVPIKVGNDTIGVIRAVNKRSDDYPEKTSSNRLLRRGFSEDCQTELEIAASHLAAMIKNAELISELNKTVNQLESLYEVGDMLVDEHDMNAVFALIVERAAQVMHAEICMLFLKNQQGDRVILTESFGMPLSLLEGAFYKLGKGKTGGVAQTGEVILEGQASSTHEGKYDKEIIAFLREKSNDSSKGIESFMAVPIWAKGNILGVIKVINKLEPGVPAARFDKKDLKRFEMFAKQIGLARFLYTQKYLQEYLTNIVENSPVPIIFLNEKGEVGIFNRACEQLWGYKSEEVIGKSVVNYYSSERHARDIGKKLWESEDRRIHNEEAEIKNSEGMIVPVILSATILFDVENNRIGSMGVFKDLREIKEYQDKMDRAEYEANIGKLADIVGHSTKSNIATARLFIDLLKEKTDKAGMTELAQTFYTRIDDALAEAVEELKSLTQSPQPKAPSKKTVFVQDVFANQIFGVLSRSANREKVDFVRDCSAAQGEVVDVDVEQIREVFRNMFNNSLDAIRKKRVASATEERGLIEVSAVSRDRQLELTWKDNGCGIPTAIRHKIFDHYFTYEKKEGTGLGLYRVHKIIENHGGQIFVDSADGQWTTFTVTLPISTTQNV